MVAVVGKTKRVKSWISSQNDGRQIDSFDEFSKPTDGETDDEGSEGAVNDDRDDASASDLDIDPVGDWEGFEDLARRSINTSKTSTRVHFLSRTLPKVVQKDELSPQQLASLLKLLLPTYARYIDADSRAAALVALNCLLKQDLEKASGKLSENVVKWLENEIKAKITASSGNVAGSTILGLLTWSSNVFALYYRHLGAEAFAAQRQIWEVLLKAVATTYDALLGSAVKKSVKKSGTIAVRRLVRNTYQAAPHMIESLSSNGFMKPESSAAALLGAVIDSTIRLRNKKGLQPGDSVKWVIERKKAVLSYLRDHIIASRVSLPPHVVTALSDFVSVAVDEADLQAHTDLVKAMDRGLLRNPEITLTILDVFFSAYSNPTSAERSPEIFTPKPIPNVAISAKLLPAILTASKSTNALTRSSAALLCTTLVQPLVSGTGEDHTVLLDIVKQIASPLRASKTVSADHRQCLTKLLLAIATLLDQLAPGTDVAHELLSDMLSAVAASVVKENNEFALQSAMELFKLCALRLLAEGHNIDISVCDTMKGLITPSTKAALRHVVLCELSDTLWQLLGRDSDSSYAAAFVEAFVLPLTVVVKQGPQPSSNIADLWAATAVLYRFSRSSHSKSPSSDLTPALELLVISPKPSFLLSDRNYRKLTDSADEIWLVRAIDSVLSVDGVLVACTANSTQSMAVANVLLHIAMAGSAHSSRQAAVKIISQLCVEPSASRMILSGLRVMVINGQTETVKVVEDELHGPGDQPARLRAVLQAVCSNSIAKDEIMLESLILSHDVAFGKRDLWISLLLSSSLDPQHFCETQRAQLLDRVWSAALDSRKSVRLSAYAALGTLLFISPHSFLADVVAHVESRLNNPDFLALGEAELGIMETQPGQLYIDVLAHKKSGGATAGKGKGAALDQWDAEMRKALELKKKVTTNGIAKLSKADQALVDEQLAREAIIRANSVRAVALARDGLDTTACLLRVCRGDARAYAADLLAALLCFVIAASARLLEAQSLASVFELYTLCDSRLQDIRNSLALTTLQAVKASIVPSDFNLDGYGPLVTSVLYRLRFQSETKPFDSVTATLSASLVCTCIEEGGLGIQQDDNDSRLEQLSLAVDVIAFHSRACTDALYPRQSFMTALITALSKYPSLGRQATQSLVDIGQAIADNATPVETQLLLSSATANELVVRTACLQALTPFDLTEQETNLQIWLAAHDVDDKASQLASQIWEDNGLDVQEATLRELVASLSSQNVFVRSAAAPAIADTVEQLSQSTESALNLLVTAYVTDSRDITDQFDRFGLLMHASSDQEDPWYARVAQADALTCLAPHWRDEDVERLFDLLINKKALGDKSESVRAKMLEAGIAAVDAKGKANLDKLSAMFQKYLATPSTSDAAGDRITESVIVLLGRLARHLDGQDQRGNDVLERLTQALKTPSEVVQIAVAECLPPLVRVNKERGSRLLEQLLRQTIKAPTYAERRGAAYGLAGAVKGRGLTALKEHDILEQLQEAAEDKKNVGYRQGAIFAYETLSTTLGRLFEPYIVKILPLLLACLGDSSTDVREATSDAAKVIMGKISGHAVKLILPVLLETLDDKQWRTKKGAIELMGNMAYLAPRQLSQSLPTILPSLTATLTDTHAQIRAAANASLKRFGEVIDNPEVKAMQSTLLGALVDPTKKTLKALDTLLKTSFVHYIDASSLALVVPIIERALRERGTELKRKGAQIIGNMASLTESRDLIYYLPQLLPRVKEVLIDPVPEARATAAKSLGILIERLGEEAFPSLVDDLMTTLKSDMSGVDQQGAAQGLAEVLSGLGVERMEAMLPEVITFTSSARAYVREGFISLLVFLPSVFGDRFAPYLGRIIQPILGGLADDSDYVREASMRAGRMIVANHSNRAVDLLLPELEESLFDERWRIRLSSIQLVGELLFRLSGISGKAEADDDAGAEDEDTYTSNNEAFKRLLEALGKERRDKVLAAIYILRQDQAGQVRMFCITVWKTLVANTPRTVRDMLPALMQLIIKLLSAPGEEQRETAARTLGELCRKQGDRILGDIIPILQQAFKGSDVTRQGCCLALAEVLDATSVTQLEGHEDAIINSVRAALVDESPRVRQAAAHAFDALQTQLGGRAIDQTIPTLLVALTQGGGASEAALSALRELMSVRAHAIFPILIPTLIASPISAFNAKSLASLVRVAGEALNKRLAQVLDALQRDVDKQPDEAIKTELENAIRSVLESVSDADGLHQLMLHLLGLAKDPRHKQRVNGCKLYAVFCEVTEQDFSAYHINWIRQLLHLAQDSTSEVVEAAGSATTAFSKTLSKEQMEDLSVSLRRTVEGLCPAGDEVPGFALPGGLKPILPIFIQGLLAGTHEQREQSAFGLGDIVERTAVDALKPYVTQITGPLIRIIAERYPPPIKAAILSTLTILLLRVPQFVRPFFPQLQRTFVKNLAELASSTVRIKAATGLGVLMSHQPRIDPLITELVNGASHDESDVRDAMASALANVVHSGGNNIGAPARESIALLVRNTFEESSKEAFNASIARVLGAMLLHEMAQAQPIIMGLYESRSVTITSSMALTTCLEIAPEQLYKISPTAPVAITNRILQNVINDQPAIARPAREGREMLKKLEPWASDESVQAKLA